MQDLKFKNLYEGSGSVIQYRYAGFGVRLVAFFIDGVILSFGFGIISYVTGMKFNSGFFEVIYNPGSFLAFLLAMSYFIYFETSDKQATIGKSLMDLKVVKQNGSRLTAKDSILRYIGKIFSAFILMIGYIMVIFDDQKQALHDRIANTYVVKV